MHTRVNKINQQVNTCQEKHDLISLIDIKYKLKFNQKMNNVQKGIYVRDVFS